MQNGSDFEKGFTLGLDFLFFFWGFMRPSTSMHFMAETQLRSLTNSRADFFSYSAKNKSFIEKIFDTIAINDAMWPSVLLLWFLFLAH